MSNAEPTIVDPEEEFVPQPSTSDKTTHAALPTLQSLSTLPQTLSVSLFSPYTFFLSRETPRPIFEFIVRSFGGRVGWPPSSGSSSPFDENDPSITHVIVDRPAVTKQETPEQRELRLRRKYVQPQWIVDCVNASKILLEEPYAQGKPLPPHLSPFGEYEGAYIPSDEHSNKEQMEGDESGDESGEEESDEVLDEALAAKQDPASLRAAELTAEATGVDYGTFESMAKQASKKQGKKTKVDLVEDAEGDMNKMMMSSKQRKLYERMKYSNNKRKTEVRICSQGLRCTR
jgi:pescadillo protein